MFAQYRHTQFATMILAVSGGFFVLMALMMLPARMAWMPLAASLVFVLLMAALFGSLTVEIEEGRLRWWFGLGLIRSSIHLADVRGASIVRNAWYYGWGIRLTPYGWLHNVSGLDAIELRLSSGKRFRLGTDEPQALLAALQEAAPLR